jgi:hypothetical protein
MLNLCKRRRDNIRWIRVARCPPIGGHVLLFNSRPPFCPPKKYFFKGIFALYFTCVLFFKFSLKSPRFSAHGSGNTTMDDQF